MKQTVSEVFAAAGVCLNGAQTRKFETYARMLQKSSAAVNLTAITNVTDIAVLHFLDSLAVSQLVEKTGGSVIDVGSGAGFPGIPLAICRGDLSVTLLEARGKRAAFLSKAAETLELANVRIINARAEDAAALRAGQFDAAVTRALAKFSLSAVYALPFVRENGRYLAMLSQNQDNDIAAALPYIRGQGGEIAGKKTYVLPILNIKRCVVTVVKRRGAEISVKKAKKAIKRGEGKT